MEPLESLYDEAKSAPPELISRTLDFLRFLKQSYSRKNYEALSLSLPVLATDWFTKEEDEAWKDLQ
jgi:hypothetical protein